MRTSSAVVTLGMLALACAPDRRGRTVTTAAEIPQPAATGTTSRTLSSTGWVDNAGRTSEERARTEASGMRPTETGADRPTGTPGSGVPVPILEPARPPSSRVGEGADRDSNVDTTSGAPADSIVGRLARARCDHEMYCGRVRPNGAFASDATCMASVRVRAREDLTRMACPNGFNAAQVALCLNGIRHATCASSSDVADALPACQRSAMCAPE